MLAAEVRCLFLKLRNSGSERQLSQDRNLFLNKPKEIWAVRIRLQMAGRVRDLARFDLGLDSKLQGCDLVKLRPGDVAIGRSIRSLCRVVQQKTGRPVQFEITDACKESLVAWLEKRGSRSDDWIFPGRSNRGGHVATRQYARLVDDWVEMIGLNPVSYVPFVPNYGINPESILTGRRVIRD